MFFERLNIPGTMLVTLDRKVDSRGFFARAYCAEEFRSHGLPHELVQCSVSHNEKAGTVRGMHFQWPPSREGKLVRCIRGRLFDVLLDLRPGSPAYLEHRALILDEDRQDAVFIPHGVAHGFQTLVDRTEVFYQMTDFYSPRLGAGVRWNDPAFAIAWPVPGAILSERDADCPYFDRESFEAELTRRSQRSRPGGEASPGT